MGSMEQFRRVLATSLLLVIGWGTYPVKAQAVAQTPPGKINIVIIEGEGAINNVRQRVAREPIVQVEDENRKPIAGAAVTFVLPQQGAGATFANGARSLTVLTDSNGRATARGMRTNNINGQYQVRVNASFQGMTASTIVSQTNAAVGAAAAGGAGISTKMIVIIVAAAGAAAAGGAIAATRGNGNGAANGGRAPAVITPGTPTVGGPQ